MSDVEELCGTCRHPKTQHPFGRMFSGRCNRPYCKCAAFVSTLTPLEGRADVTVFHPVQSQRRIDSMPESVVLKAYEVYCHLYGPQPAMVDVPKGCRGGFSVGELIAFLYAHTFPKNEWRERVDEALERQVKGEQA